jgi:hypothetical protein
MSALLAFSLPTMMQRVNMQQWLAIVLQRLRRLFKTATSPRALLRLFLLLWDSRRKSGRGQDMFCKGRAETRSYMLPERSEETLETTREIGFVCGSRIPESTSFMPEASASTITGPAIGRAASPAPSKCASAPFLQLTSSHHRSATPVSHMPPSTILSTSRLTRKLSPSTVPSYALLSPCNHRQ